MLRSENTADLQDPNPKTKDVDQRFGGVQTTRMACENFGGSALPSPSSAATVPTMPVIAPLTSSGSHDPAKPRSVPKAIRDVIVLMVRGPTNEPDGAPLSFITAAKVCGVKPDIMRRWLDRAEVIKLLRAERRAFRESICASNELALARVRNKSENGMAVIGAVRALEQISEQEVQAGRGPEVSPGLCIVISDVRPREPITTIDVHPTPAPASAENESSAPSNTHVFRSPWT